MNLIPHQSSNGDRYTEPTYGGWATPRAQGIPGLSPVATGVVVVALLVAIPMWILAGPLEGLAAVAGSLVALALVGLRVGGRSLGQRGAARLVFAFGAARGATIYRSGPGSARPGVGHSLPGLLAGVVCHEPVGPGGEPFALLEHPGGRWSVVLACSPTGEELVTDAVLDNRVAAWGGFLAELACWPEIVCLQQTIQTSPDLGAGLRFEVERLLDLGGPDVPAVAGLAVEQSAAALSAGSVERSSWCAVTFTTAVVAAQAPQEQRAAVMGRHLARLLPALEAGLNASGAGSVHPMTPGELARVVRCAFDPTAVLTPGRLSWDRVGPVTAVESWGSWRHDAATSSTWSMTDAPQGAVTRDALAALLAPDRSGATRRVTLTYRPHRADVARVLATRGVRQASWRVLGRPGVGDAGDQVGLGVARQTQRELAQGAALVSFTAHVTATVTGWHPLALERVALDTELAAAGAGVELRRCWAHHNAAFSTALGVGVDLEAHTWVPAAIRRNL